MNIPQAIMHLFPNSDPLKDFVVQDDSDGQGAYIAKWNMQDTQPTPAQLEQAWSDYLSLPVPPVPPTEVDSLGELLVQLDLRLLKGGL